MTLHRLFVQADGRVSWSTLRILYKPCSPRFPQTHDLLIGPESPADHLTQKYTNTIVGRYANRVPVASPDAADPSFTLSRNGHTSDFTPLSNESPTVSLHGGRIGFDSVEWTPLVDPSESELFSDAEKQHLSGGAGVVGIIFKRVSEDGEEGYPGRLLVEALVSLVEPSGPQTQSVKEGSELKLGNVVIVYRAKLLDEGKVTPINLTQVSPWLECFVTSAHSCIHSTGVSTWMPLSRMVLLRLSVSKTTNCLSRYTNLNDPPRL